MNKLLTACAVVLALLAMVGVVQASLVRENPSGLPPSTNAEYNAVVDALGDDPVVLDHLGVRMVLGDLQQALENGVTPDDPWMIAIREELGRMVEEAKNPTPGATPEEIKAYQNRPQPPHEAYVSNESTCEGTPESKDVEFPPDIRCVNVARGRSPGSISITLTEAGWGFAHSATYNEAGDLTSEHGIVEIPFIVDLANAVITFEGEVIVAESAGTITRIDTSQIFPITNP